MVKLMGKMGLVLAFSMVSAVAQAAEPVASGIKIENAWVREVPPSASNSAGYLTIVNSGAADRLVAAQSGAAKATELHEMKMENGIMGMNRLLGVDIPAGKTVSFEPGGMHVMFIKLKQPLKAGDKVELILEFEKAGKVNVSAPVVKKN